MSTPTLQPPTSFVAPEAPAVGPLKDTTPGQTFLWKATLGGAGTATLTTERSLLGSIQEWLLWSPSALTGTVTLSLQRRTPEGTLLAGELLQGEVALPLGAAPRNAFGPLSTDEATLKLRLCSTCTLTLTSSAGAADAGVPLNVLLVLSLNHDWRSSHV